MPVSIHKDDVKALLERRGWIRGAGGDLYFPVDAKPHLHVGLKAGYH